MRNSDAFLNKNPEANPQNEKQLQLQAPHKHRINMKALLKKKGWTGKWSGREETKYINFLITNQEIMKEKGTRKRNKVFVKMAKCIRTRNSDQCRSHHQKLIYYHGNTQNIINHFRLVIFQRMQSRKKELELQSDQAIFTGSRTKSRIFDPFYQLTVQGSRIRIQIDADRIKSFPLD